MSELLMEEIRGNLSENQIYGRVCIVDYSGSIVYSLGETDMPHFYRSSAKPIQALPTYIAGAKEKFGLTDEEFAIFCASHRGEKFHIAALESILSKTGIKEEDMILPPAWPSSTDAMIEAVKEGKKPRKLMYNCSGKHSSLLTLSKLMGEPAEDYWKPDCAVQKTVKKYIAKLSEYPEEKIIVGTDGCGVPVWGIPLYNIALSYLNLACPERLNDPVTENAVRHITKYMNEYPKMIAGTNEICSLLLEDENIVAKGGACALYCIGLKREKLGIALKIESGEASYIPYVVLNVLKKIGYSNKKTLKRIKDMYPSDFINHMGVLAYTRKSVI